MVDTNFEMEAVCLRGDFDRRGEARGEERGEARGEAFERLMDEDRDLYILFIKLF